jgi:hypothetical protein
LSDLAQDLINDRLIVLAQRLQALADGGLPARELLFQ